MEFLFVQVAGLLKKARSQVFSCEYCKSFKSTYFEEYLREGLLLKIGIKCVKLRLFEVLQNLQMSYKITNTFENS